MKPETAVVRLPLGALQEVDAWIGRQADPKPTRPEAIRRLLQGALARELRPSIDEQIAAVEERLAAPDVERGPSPEAGMEALRRGLNENDLRTLRERKRRASKSK